MNNQSMGTRESDALEANQVILEDTINKRSPNKGGMAEMLKKENIKDSLADFI